MTLLKNFLGFIALTGLLFSCKKEMSTEGVKSPAVIDASWEFTESGKIFKGDIDTAYITEGMGFSILTLEGTTEDGTTGQIILEVAGETIAPGNYSEDRVNFLYGESSGVVYSSVAGSNGFSITIISIDSASVTGTFSGTVKGADGPTDKTIVDGKFTAPIGKSNLETIEPDPNNDDYFTLGSQWVYASQNDPADLVTITTIGDTTIDVPGGPFLYTVFENSRTGEHKYYRKDENNFYQFSSILFGGDTAPDEIDLLILKQNAPAGDLWETEPYSFTTGSGPTINAKLVSEIGARDYSSVLNGVQYQNLIQVDTHLEVQIGGSYSSPGSSYSTVFSKGIGIVSYYDFNLESYYVLKSYVP